MKKDNDTIITIKPLTIQKAKITIVGDTPLIVHAWSEKAKKDILDREQKRAKDKKAKPAKDPFAEFMDALYWVTEKPAESTVESFEKAIASGAKFGFPITAIKQAALSACYRAGIIPNQTGMKCAFFLNSTSDTSRSDNGSELAVIETDEAPVLREDAVKVGGVTKNADLRYRPMFNHWKMNMTISLIDVGTFTMESIINAINLGGYMNGIGEWRMERDGDFGHFHVEVNS